MRIIECIQTKNPSYTRNRKIQPVGIFFHSTGANNPNLKRYVDCVEELGVNQYGNHWNKPSATKSMHAFIGKDKNGQIAVAHTLPYDRACWGAGGGTNGSYNYNPQAHVQFEVCEDSLTNATYYNAVITVTEDYCVYLCKLLNLSPDTIVGHFEAAKRGYASNHGDPKHWMDRHGDTMDKFRSRVKAKLAASNTPQPSEPKPEPKPPEQPTPPVPQPEDESISPYDSRHKVNLKITRQENATYHKKPVGSVIALDIEDYLCGVVPSEIGNAPMEACKAQAIAARTFAYVRTQGGNVIDDTTAYQAYRAPRNNIQQYPNAINAVLSTKGIVLCYKGKVAETTVYSHSNGGRTVSSKERWGGERAYLVSGPDPWDAATGAKKNGHGVGMSQMGAVYAAEKGIHHRKILDFYYPGTNVCLIGYENIIPKPEPTKYAGKYMTVTTAKDAGIFLWSTTTKASKLIQVPKGKLVFVLRDGDAPGWVWAEHGGIQGYADLQYLVEAADTTPNPIPPPETPPTIEAPLTPAVEMIVKTTIAAYIGLWNNKSKGQRLIRVNKGEKVKIIDSTDKAWFLAEYQGVQGYADTRYLVAAPTQPPPEGEFGSYLATVQTRFGGGISIWTDPRKSKRLLRVADTFTVRVLGYIDDNWAHVERDGVRGVADRQYLKRL